MAFVGTNLQSLFGRNQPAGITLGVRQRISRGLSGIFLDHEERLRKLERGKYAARRQGSCAFILLDGLPIITSLRQY